MPSLSAYHLSGVSLTLDVGYLFMAALAKHSRLSLPWMWGSSSQPLPRMGKTGDVFKKIRDTKGSFHAKMVSIKDRNDRDLTEAEDIKKRWQKYTEELCEKDLHNPDNHDGVITPRARHPGMRSQVGLRKHHYEQS